MRNGTIGCGDLLLRRDIRIAERGSFTRAAAAMRTTQAGVSLKLKRLEMRLGCRRIERTRGPGARWEARR